MHAHLKDAGAGLDLSDQLKDSASLHLDPPPNQDAVKAIQAKRESVKKLHTGALGALWSVEQSLGKAYLLGYEMEQMCALPPSKKALGLKRQLTEFRPSPFAADRPRVEASV